MIYVFKTSVKTKKDIRKLKSCLDELCKPANWSFDLDDCDNVLRVNNDLEICGLLIKLLSANGFLCEELQ